jgi:hypothetical protein
MMELEDRKRLAAGVLASMEGMPHATVRALAQGLRLAGGPLGGLGTAFDNAADWLEFEDVTGWLAELNLASRLGELARDGEALALLEGVSEPPWPALRRALVAMRADG